MTQQHPIGVFDSGIGGLSVARKIRLELPAENLLYIADSLHAPYGNKPEAYIIDRAMTLGRFLVKNSAKAIVVACNTATVSTIQHLRAEFSLPIIGVEPGVKPAAAMSKSGVVGILATERTLQSESFLRLSNRFLSSVKVEVQPCPGLVEQIENLEFNSTTTLALVRKYVQPLLNKGADTIVLGCTHYPFVMPLIQEVAGQHTTIIDTGISVAREVRRRLETENLLSEKSSTGRDLFFCSGDVQRLRTIGSSLWKSSVEVLPLNTNSYKAG